VSKNAVAAVAVADDDNGTQLLLNNSLNNKFL